MLAEGSELAPDFLDLVRSEREKVRTVMNTDITSVTEDTSVTDIAKLLVGKSIKRAPVVNGAWIVGIVSRADLVRALAKG